jgi:hypothetical protein
VKALSSSPSTKKKPSKEKEHHELEANVGSPQARGQPGVHTKTLSQKTKKMLNNLARPSQTQFKKKQNPRSH